MAAQEYPALFWRQVHPSFSDPPVFPNLLINWYTGCLALKMTKKTCAVFFNGTFWSLTAPVTIYFNGKKVRHCKTTVEKVWNDMKFGKRWQNWVKHTQTTIKPTLRSHGRLTSQHKLLKESIFLTSKDSISRSNLKMNYKLDQKRHS